MDEEIKNALRLAMSGKSREKTLSEDEKMKRLQELLQGFKPEVGSPGYWEEREKVYSKPRDQRQGPDDPQRYISPEEYRKGYIGRKEYVLANGGRAGYAIGGTGTPATTSTNFLRPTTGTATTSPFATRPTGNVTTTRPTGNVTPPRPTTAPAIEPGALNYVTSVYQTLTGKPPSAPVLNSLATDLAEGHIGVTDVVQNAAGTSDFQNLYKNNPTTAAQSLAQTLFAREPTRQDMSFWGSKARKQPLDTFLNDITGSRTAQDNAAVYDLYRGFTGSIPNREQAIQAADAFRRTSNYDDFIERAFPKIVPTGGTQVAGDWRTYVRDTAPKLSRDLGEYAHQVYTDLIKDADLRNVLPGLIGQESGGARDPYTAKAKTSSAAGLFQFIDGTWLAQFAKTFGDQLGLTEREKQEWQSAKRNKITPLQRAVLNLRTDNSPYGQAINMAMGTAFNKANADKLKAAGLPITPENVYSVHLTGDVKLAREAAKNPNAPISQGMSRSQLRANRSYQGKTVGQVMNMIGNFFTPEQGKVQKGQSIVDNYAEQARIFNRSAPPIVDPALVTRPPPVNTPPSPPVGAPPSPPVSPPVQTPPAVPATGPGVVIPETQIPPSDPTQNLLNSLPSGGAGTGFVPGGGTGFVPGGGGTSGAADISGAGGDYTGGHGGGGTGHHAGHGGSHTTTPHTSGGVHTAPVVHHTPVHHTSTPTSHNFGVSVGPDLGSHSVHSPSFSDYAVSHVYGHSTVGQGPYDAWGSHISKWEHTPFGGPARDYDLYTFGNTGGVMSEDRAVSDALRIARKAGGRSPAWTRKEGQNPEGGLNEKGRASLRAQGHDIKRPQPEGGPRRDSFCARSAGQAKMFPEAAKDPNSRLNKARRKWNCADGGAIDDALRIAQSPNKPVRMHETLARTGYADGGKPVWDKPRPKSLGKPESLSDKQKASAKAAAKAAGRPWPNMIDNLRAAQRKK